MTDEKPKSKIRGAPLRLPESRSTKAATPARADIAAAYHSIKSPLLKRLYEARIEEKDGNE